MFIYMLEQKKVQLRNESDSFLTVGRLHRQSNTERHAVIFWQHNTNRIHHFFQGMKSTVIKKKVFKKKSILQ